MAYFAELDQNNIVTKVIFVSNDDILDDNGNESEEIGINFLEKLYGHRNWKQTSYNNNFRFRYAGIGYEYHEVPDGFSEPQPYDSWIFNEETLSWNAPVEKPENVMSVWDEDLKDWVILDFSIE